MAGQVLSVEGADRWLKSLENPGKWGWMPEHKKIGKHIRAQHRLRLKAHIDPDGKPWPRTYHVPRPKKGDRVPLLISDEGQAKVIVQTIRTTAGKRKAVAFREKYKATQPPYKPEKALIRTGGKRKVRRIWDYLVGKGLLGRSLRMGKDFLHYGYTRGTRWIEELHFGGTFKGKRVPPRQVVGLNKTDIDMIEKIYADGYEKRVAKGAF